MECDLVERKNMQDILSDYREKVDLVIRDIYMSLVSASSKLSFQITFLMGLLIV